MPRRLIAIVALVVVGCTSSGTSAQSSPSTQASATPSSGAGQSPTTSPTGAPTSNPAVIKVAFSCRLPVVTHTTGGDGTTFQGGFITFPAGSYAEDPKGLINVIYPTGGFVTRQTPVLKGALDNFDAPFFDAAAGRWVPSSAAHAAPDGSSYAYATTGDQPSVVTFHIVRVSSATEKTYALPLPVAGTGVQVMDYDGAGVYFVVTQFEVYPVGVWRLDATSGRVSTLTRVANVMDVRAGYAWAGALDPHDPYPPPVAASRQLFDSILQVNLANAAQTTWFYSPGRSETLLGLASNGLPVLNISDAPDYPVIGGETRYLDHPSTGAEDSGQLVWGGGIRLVDPQGDGDRVWFGSDSGLYLYTSAGGLQEVFAFPPDPTTGRTMSPAGLCR